MKQINACANMLQLFQHMLLYGHMHGVPITQDLFVKEDFKIRRTTENVRRLANYDDAIDGMS